MDRTLVLIGRAHQGDKAARDLLFEENTGLIYSVATVSYTHLTLPTTPYV